MAGSVRKYIKKRLLPISGIGEITAERISCYFDTIEDFVTADFDILQNIRYLLNGVQLTVTLSDDQYESIKEIQNSIDTNERLNSLYTELLVTDFVSKVKLKLEQLSLRDLNCNPFLAASLKLVDDPDKFFKFNVWAFAQRSIVTSFGNTVEDLLLYSSEDVKPGIRTDSGGEKWDLSKVVDEVKYWLEIKSGPNDMDLTQIRRYLTKMSKVEEDGVRGLFGMTYGNLDSDTVTLGLLSRYVEDWEEKVLIGRKLWDFLAGEEGYAVDIFYRIKSVADNILGRVDIISLIDARVEDIINDYNENYENLTEYLNTQY